MALAGLVTAGMWAADVPALTLDDCLRLALSDNPTVKVADMEITRADYSRSTALGRLLPSLDFAGSYSRTVAKQVMYMNMDAFPGFGGGTGGDVPANPEDSDTPQARAAASAGSTSSKGSSGIKMGLDNSYTLGFQASMPLLAPQLWTSMALSDVQIKRSLEAASQSRQKLYNQVKSAYYGVLLAMDSRKTVQDSYEMARLTHETYVKKYNSGAASDYDVLRTSVAMKNIEPEMMQADIAVKRALLNLQLLMGAPEDFEFTVSGKLADYESTMYEKTIESIGADYSNNADIRLMDIDKDILGKNLKMQKQAFIPTVALTANYNWVSMSNGSPFQNFRWNPYSTVGLSLSFPIFRGGERWNNVRSTQVQLSELELQRQNLDRSINMQVKLALDNIKTNVKQIATAGESVKQAEKAHDIMVKSFAIGAASYLDLRDSELALTRAQLGYYQAIYNYLVASGELELLMGTAPLDNYAKK